MAAYPNGWADSDLAGAVAALTAAGAVVTSSTDGKRLRTVAFTVNDRPCTLTERTPRRRGEHVQFELPWPAAWPELVLSAEGDPYVTDCLDPSPPPGFELWSEDLPTARAVVDAGFAAAARSPRAGLSVELAAGALVTAEPRIALNAATAAWLLGLAQTLLAAAPPAGPDDVSGSIVLDGDRYATVYGTRAEVTHRLVWVRRVHRSYDDPETTEFLRSLDDWLSEAAALATASRAAGADLVRSRQQVRELSARLARTVQLVSADDPDADDDDELLDDLRQVLDQIGGWDE